MTLGVVDLSYLTDEEREKILQVIRRDDQLRDTEQIRIRSLKDAVKSLRLKGTIREGRNATKTCARCRAPFGIIFNTGSVCQKCQHRVCKKCQETVPSGSWICVFCFRQMEYEAKSGNWFYSRFPRTMRNRETNEIVSGGKIVQDAISNIKPVGKSSKTILAQHARILPVVAVEQHPRQDGQTTTISATRPDSLATTLTPHRQQELRNIPPNQTTPTMPAPQTVPVIEIIPDHDDIQFHGDNPPKVSDELDSFGRSRTLDSNALSNLGRLSAMSGSTESVVSYYSCAGEANFGKIPVTGEIQFGVRYQPKASALEVVVRRCKDLAAADPKKNRSDPYVKCYLLPDKSRAGKRKTHCKKNTLNPIFDEVLKFSVKIGEIETRTLSIMVWNYDRFGRNDFLGEVNLNLTSDVLEDTALKWYPLCNRVSSPLSALAYKGDLDISLKFDNVKRVGGKVVSITDHGDLQITVKQARHLTALRSSDASDPFCQAYLLPHRSKNDKQKTAVIKHTCDPVWNHTFTFDHLTEDELRDGCVELTIWDHDRITSHEFLGGVRLNLGTGRASGKEVDWMDAKGDELSLWQAMLDRPSTWIDGTLLLRVNMTPRK